MQHSAQLGPVHQRAASPSLDHVELVDRVYVRLKQMIFDQELKPGQKIVQEKVAEELGVSRSPLLKALHRLESEMLVESFPRRGMYVKELSLDEVVDIFQCRAVLEGLSARLAAERCSAEAVQELRACFEPFRHQHPIDYGAYAQADRRFHDTLMRLSGNKVIDRLEMLSNIHLQAFQVGLARSPEETLPEHFAIITAIESGDGAAAETHMRAHIDQSRLAIQRQHGA